MNRDDVIRMAREAYWAAVKRFNQIDPMRFEHSSAFYESAALDEGVLAAVAAEREACAKVCEGRAQEGLRLEGCAAAIRARGQS